MNWTKIILTGAIVWFMQIIVADLLAIDSVRPDFVVILILYWSIKYGRFFGIISGTVLGLIFDLSGTANFFGLSPLIYTITGYISGNLHGVYTKLNPFYFSISWIIILCFQFLIFCSVQYQDIWVINQKIFFGKWIGTSIYTIAFTGILQFIHPLHRLN